MPLMPISTWIKKQKSKHPLKLESDGDKNETNLTNVYGCSKNKPRNDNNNNQFLGALLEQPWMLRQVLDYLPSCDAHSVSIVNRKMRSSSIQLVHCPVVNRDGHWYGPSGCGVARRWQELQFPAGAALHSVVVSCDWKDQGWGFQKGMLSIMRNEDVAPQDFAPWQGVVAGKTPAPKNWGRTTLSFRPETDGAGNAAPHRYVLWIREGGGGGHQLYVRNLEVKVLAYRE